MVDVEAGVARPAAVVFGEGRRPEAATHVTMAEFEGPLALLLALIEARELDVLTVPLGALADAYLDALATLDADRLGNVSSFVAIASQLILIKSRHMLPRQAPAGAVPLPDDGLDPEAELRARLLLYRAYRDAGTSLAGEALRRVGLFRREPGVAHTAAMAGARPVDAPPLSPQPERSNRSDATPEAASARDRAASTRWENFFSSANGWIISAAARAGARGRLRPR